ncbi:MAG: type II toxin-antitoxin system RelE/ParE family toxin [Helicobacteraceae bacterium]|nr:type II toxin-antitoxin system RelE/ParE family toxin [Helicobacteraceae bacterium]
MQVEIKKKFLKELSKLSIEYADTIEEFVFDKLPNYNNLSEIGKVEKMTGYKNYFKIRFGDYRVGIKKENDTIIIETVKHRRDIYKYFP